MNDAVGPWVDALDESFRSSAALPPSVDVVVVGGGIVGAATAYYLASRGVAVVLVEKGRVAGEQSGRNWGWVRQQARDPAELPLMIESNRLWRALEAELGADVEWTSRGNLALATDPARVAFFREWQDVARAANLDTRLLTTTSEIRSLVPQLAGEWLGAMYTPSDGHAEPVKATRAFARAAQGRGATVAEGCSVDRILVEGGRVVGVETERGPVRARWVICAAGVWSARLLRPLGLDLPVRIVLSTVTATEPVPALTEIAVGYHPTVSFRQRPDGSLYLAAGGWSDYDITLESLRHLRYFMPNYLKNRKLIRLHVGRPLVDDVARLLTPWRRDAHPWRRQRILSPAPNDEKVRISIAEFRRLVPSIPVTPTRSWAGFTDTTPDALPVIEALAKPEGLVIASGFAGHGFGMGPIVGRLIAERVVDGTPSMDLGEFRLSRFADGTFAKPRLVG